MYTLVNTCYIDLVTSEGEGVKQTTTTTKKQTSPG